MRVFSCCVFGISSLDSAFSSPIFKLPYLFHFSTKSPPTKPIFHHFRFSFIPIDQNLQQIHQMAESSKKRKGSSTSTVTTGTPRLGATRAPPAPISSSLSSSMLFSSDEQHIQYSSHFSSRSILDPKYLDLKFFDDEVFDCFQAFQNSELIQFMSLKIPHYLELVRAFYSNLQIQGSTLIYEVHGIRMQIDESVFFELTQLSNQGVPFEGTIVDDWKFDFSSLDARRMVYTDQAKMSSRLLAGSLTFECRIMHYLIMRILLPRSSNLVQVSEEDLIVMWVFLTGRQID